MVTYDADQKMKKRGNPKGTNREQTLLKRVQPHNQVRNAGNEMLAELLRVLHV